MALNRRTFKKHLLFNYYSEIMDSRWRNLGLLLLVVFLVLGIVFSSNLVGLAANTKFLPLVFNSRQLSTLDSSVGKTEAEKMQSIRDHFRIVDKETSQPVGPASDLQIREVEGGNWALLIPNLAPNKDYQYAISITGYSPLVGDLDDVEEGELTNG